MAKNKTTHTLIIKSENIKTPLASLKKSNNIKDIIVKIGWSNKIHKLNNHEEEVRQHNEKKK